MSTSSRAESWHEALKVIALQEAKIKALRNSLNWALSNISEEPYEWSSEEDADAHNAESSGAQHPTRMPGYRAGTNTGD